MHHVTVSGSMMKTPLGEEEEEENDSESDGQSMFYYQVTTFKY